MTPGLSEPVQIAIWSGPIVTALGAIGTVLATWVRTKAELHALRDHVVTTVTQTSKVGDGFADDVRAGLRRLEDATAEMHKDIGGLRSEIRDERRERLEADRRLEEAQRVNYPRPGGLS